MRIAYLANFSPRKLGTGEDRLMALAAEAHDRGHPFHVFCHRPVHADVAEALDGAGAVIEELSDLGRRPWLAARRLSREFDVIQINAIAPRSRLALVAYAAWPARVLYVDHNSGPPAHRERARPALIGLLDRVTFVRVRQVAGVSDYVRERARERFGLGPDRVRTLYGGVDTERFRPQAAPRAREGPLRVSTVAALIEEKGIGVLLEALKRSDSFDWRLSIAGEGPDRPRLEAMATSLGIDDRVSFLGLRDDVDRILRDSDVFVHPAVWQEALGYTILEGMASGCCVLASRVGGIPELIEHGRDGLLVEPGDVAGLSAALIRVAGDPALRERLAAAARARILDRFTLRASVRATFDWFEETVQ